MSEVVSERVIESASVRVNGWMSMHKRKLSYSSILLNDFGSECTMLFHVHEVQYQYHVSIPTAGRREAL